MRDPQSQVPPEASSAPNDSQAATASQSHTSISLRPRPFHLAYSDQTWCMRIEMLVAKNHTLYKREVQRVEGSEAILYQLKNSPEYAHTAETISQLFNQTQAAEGTEIQHDYRFSNGTLVPTRLLPKPESTPAPTKVLPSVPTADDKPVED